MDKKETYEIYHKIETKQKKGEYTKNSSYGLFREQLRRYNMVYNKWYYLNKKKEEGKELTKTQLIFLKQLKHQLDRIPKPTMYTSKEEHIKVKILASKIFEDLQKKDIYIKYNTIMYALTRIASLSKLTYLLNKQQRKEDVKLYEAKEDKIIYPELKNISEIDLEKIKNRLYKLEETKYIDIDIDYTDKHSVLIAYQQLSYYKKVGIKLQDKPNNLDLIGIEEILDKEAQHHLVYEDNYLI